MARIGDERQAAVVVALRPVRIAPLSDNDVRRQVDAGLGRAVEGIGGRERVAADLGPVGRVARVHLRIAGGVRIHRRVIGEPRVVIHVVERAVVDGRGPQFPVFIRQAGLGRTRRRGIDGKPGQRARIDAARAARRVGEYRRQVASGTGAAIAEKLRSEACRDRAGTGSVGRIRRRDRAARGDGGLGPDVLRRDVLPARTGIGWRAAVSARGVHRPRAVAAVLADDVVGQEVVEHRRRIVDGQDDVRLGLVLDVDRLIGERCESGVRRRRQRPEAQQHRKQRRQPAADERRNRLVPHVLFSLYRFHRSIACRNDVEFWGPSTRTVTR